MTLTDLWDRHVAVPSDVRAHLPMLRLLAASSDGVVEFGTRHAVSAAALAVGAADSRHPAGLTCVDLVRQPEVTVLAAACAAAGVRFEFVRRDTRELPPVACDLLFIDTLHTADQLAAELDRHAAGVRRWIALHDTVTFGVRGEVPGTAGLRAAVDAFLAARPEWAEWFTSPADNGMTVLRRVLR